MFSFGRHFTGLLILLTACTGFLIYLNALNAPFLFDDYQNIVDNIRIRDISNFLPPLKSRDIGYLSFALNYSLSRFNVLPYHIVNIAIHICNALLVYALYLLLLKHVRPTGTDRGNGFLAAAISLIFLAHPLQTGAVTYIVQRFTSLASLFFLLSLLFYSKASLRYSYRNGFLSVPHLSLYIAAALSAVLAMKTKEIAFTIPLMIGMTELFLNASADRTSFRRKPFRYFLPFIATVFIIPAGIINTDIPLGEIIGEISEKSIEAELIGRPEYLITQFRVIATYLRLMFIPLGQNLDYDYRISTAMLEPAVVLALAVHVFLLVAAFLIFRKARRGVVMLIPYGVFWFYISLSVESSIIPIRDVIFEHRLYLPSSGLIAAAAALCLIIDGRLFHTKSRRILIISFLIIVSLLSMLTIQRNMLWQDGIALWKDTISKSPYKSRPYSNLANLYHKRGMHDEAANTYLKAIELSPDLPGLYNNLGNVYKSQGLYRAALDEYTRSVQMDEGFSEGYFNRGATLYEIGEFEEALPNLFRAIEISPDMFEAYTTIGNIFDDMGMKKDALHAYAKSLEINPYSHLAYYNRGVLYESVGDTNRARDDYRKAIALYPGWGLPMVRLQELTAETREPGN